MRRAVTSFAILSTLNTRDKKNYLEIFTPFVATLFVKDKIAALSEDQVNEFCDKFLIEFGLRITPQAMTAILRKAQKYNLLTKYQKSFIVNDTVAYDLDFSNEQSVSTKQNKNFQYRFKKYCSEKFNLPITDDEIDEVLLKFLKNNDIELLIQDTNHSLIADSFHLTKKFRKYEQALNCFIVDSYEDNDDCFKYLSNISFGHILASTITIEDYDFSQDTVKDCNLFFDTPLIFHYIGTDGEHKENSVKILIDSIIENGGRIKIFKHSYNEVISNLEIAINALEANIFDYRNANLTAKNYKYLGYSADQVKNIRDSLKSLLSEFEIVEKPSHLLNKDFQIDSSKLEELIRNEFHDYLSELSTTIKNDKDSIVAIYHLRKNNSPKLTREAKNIFLTTNYGLIKANIKYNNLEKERRKELPACITDVFLGTVLWINSHKKIEFNKEKFIASCYNAIKPSDALKDRLIEIVEQCKDDRAITEESAYHLIESKEVERMLVDKTLGDPNLFTSKTVLEIEKELNEKIKAPFKKEIEKLNKTNKNNKHTINNLKNEVHDLTKKNSKSIEEKNNLKRKNYWLKHKWKIRFSYLKHPLPILEFFIIIATLVIGFTITKWALSGLLLVVVSYCIFKKASVPNMKIFSDYKKSYIDKHFDKE